MPHTTSDGAPSQLHSCNLLADLDSHNYHTGNTAGKIVQFHAARPAWTSAEVTDPATSSAVIATSRWSRHAPSTSR